MSNIKFNYLYRDFGNNKQHNFVILSNRDNIHLTTIIHTIQQNLIDGIWFNAKAWNLPDLHFDKWDTELDHGMHEFENVEYTDETATMKVDAADFLEILRPSSYI